MAQNINPMLSFEYDLGEQFKISYKRLFKLYKDRDPEAEIITVAGLEFVPKYLYYVLQYSEEELKRRYNRRFIPGMLITYTDKLGNKTRGVIRNNSFKDDYMIISTVKTTSDNMDDKQFAVHVNSLTHGWLVSLGE